MHIRRQKKIANLEAALKSEREIAALAVVPPHPGASAPAPSDLRLWTEPNGMDKLELGNQPLASPAAATPEQRRRLVALLIRLRPWVENTSLVPAVSKEPSPTAAAKESP